LSGNVLVKRAKPILRSKTHKLFGPTAIANSDIDGKIINYVLKSLVRTETIEKGLPLYLKTKYAFHAPPSDVKYSFRNELVRELLDLPLDERLEAKEFVA
jgi:hypothetical protein